MISAGILRNLDPVGRIVIPKNMREALKLKDQTSTEPGSTVEISLVGEEIILKKYNPGCACCYKEDEKLTEVLGIKVCNKCLREFEAASKKLNKMNI
nr:AbrB/MazE/SpoVT family DNA-binding domain-containing protein [Clostridium neonatale]